MLLVVNGASGAGKSMIRERIAARLGVESVEIRTLRPDDQVRTTAQRQMIGERAVAQAAQLDRSGIHLLFCGDPFPPGEVLACPSAELVDIAVCLLDVSAEEQIRRLRQRGEPEDGLVHHVAFAEWMRAHSADPRIQPEVITGAGWSEMVWDRWATRTAIPAAWCSSVIDTTDLTPDEVVDHVTTWGRRALAGTIPVFRRGWHHLDPGR